MVSKFIYCVLFLIVGVFPLWENLTQAYRLILFEFGTVKIFWLTRIIVCFIFSTGLSYTALAQYQVGHASFSFPDPDRNNFAVYGEVYYPATTAGDDVLVATGGFPVIVFGHGFLTAWSEYDVWWNELVPCGYIMIFPRTQSTFSVSHSEFAIDLSFLVDTYLAENGNPASAFYQRINGKSAIMGHAMGGGVAYLAAEQNNNSNTIITLAAVETNPSAIAAAANINIPAMTIAGSLDCVASPIDNEIPIYNNLASVYKNYVEIIDGSHCNFSINSAFATCSLGETSACSTTVNDFIAQTQQHTQMFALSKPWLDYYLKDDCQGWTDFQTYAASNNNVLHTFLESGTETGCLMNIVDFDNDGMPDDLDPDDDNDGIPDLADLDPLNPFICGDLDLDGCEDCTQGVDGLGPLSDSNPNNDGPDFDGDGICDSSDTDDDNDGVVDVKDSEPFDANVQ